MGIAADIIQIVLAGLIGGLIAHFLRQPLLVGYILAGVMLSPKTIGPRVHSVEDIELLAEIGVALLLFALGLELSLKDLKPVRTIALIGGPIQIALTTLFGYALGSAFGFSPRESIWFGAMISLSSTMVVLKTLTAAGLTTTLASRVMIGLLVVQDLALPPLLIMLPRGDWSDGFLWNTAVSVGQGAVFLAGMIVLGTKVFPRALRIIAGWESRELFLLSVVALGIGVGYGTYLFGLSFALGAFVAGIVLSESELAHQALSDIAPLRDIFGLLFFASVGMLFDPHFLLDHSGKVAAAVLLILGGKFFIFALLAAVFGYRNMAPWIIGFGLAQVGEFSFVLARTGRAEGAIGEGLYNLIITSTIVTMVFSPVISSLAPYCYRLWRHIRPQNTSVNTIELPDAAIENHVIVAGCGRAGHAVVQVMKHAGVPHVVIEHNHARATSLNHDGIAVIWGDCSREQILEAAGVKNARLLVLAVPEIETVRLAIMRARVLNPTLQLVARAGALAHLTALHDLGVSDVVQPEYEGGLALVRQALERLEFPLEEIRDLARTARSDLYRLKAE